MPQTWWHHMWNIKQHPSPGAREEESEENSKLVAPFVQRGHSSHHSKRGEQLHHQKVWGSENHFMEVPEHVFTYKALRITHIVPISWGVLLLSLVY